MPNANRVVPENAEVQASVRVPRGGAASEDARRGGGSARVRWLRALCVAALLAAFVTDLLTPQLFIAAILLDVPIVLSSIGGNRSFTYGLVVAALVANAAASYANGVQDGHHWDAVGLGNRVLAALSIVFVGYLSTAAQENAHRTGRLVAQRARAEREAKLAAAIDRVRASLSPDLVMRSIAREATRLLGARSARFVVTDGGQTTTLVAGAGSDEVSFAEGELSPELSSLVRRTIEEGDVLVVRRSDALGRLALDTLQATTLLALPITDRDGAIGAILALADSPGAFDEVVNLARAYADQASSALAQARLFSQLAKRNEELVERSGVIRDLVYALSHDLRTPLAALGMTLRQAESGTYGELPLRYREILGRSIAAIDDLQRLAETLLLVARIESGDRRPRREFVELGPMVRQVAGELEALAAERRVRLEVEGKTPVTTVGDRGDLRRAATNLIANALEHTPEGGVVTIELAQEAQAVVVRVIDDGHGVAEAARRNLFSRFAQTEPRLGGGSGLGLYLVRRVAEESHGSVSYEPGSPRGSVFTLRLPAAPI